MIICPKCGNKAQDGAIFCDQCGTRLASEPAPAVPAAAPAVAIAGKCPSCGFINVPGEAFCENCGTKLAAVEPEAAPAAPADLTEGEVAGVAAVSTPPAAPAAAPAAGKVCPACGAAASPDDDFCYACGADLRAPAEAAAAPAVPEAAAPAAPEVAAPVAPAVPEVAPAPAAAVIRCPACGAEAKPGAAFCDVCGANLTAPAPAPQPAAPAPVVVPGTGPRLIVAASGAEIPLPAKAEILVGREDPVSGIFPDVDLSPHGGEEGGVSRRHLKIIVQGGQYSVEDLNSTNYTLVNKKRLDPGVQQPLADGDEVRAGRVRLVFKAS